jgi:hypothetical protein
MNRLLRILENWIPGHWLAIVLAALFPVWGILIWTFDNVGSRIGIYEAICLLLPLGFLNNLLITTDHSRISSLFILSVLGFFIGWIVLSLWRWKIWTRVLIVAMVILNSCGYVYYALSQIQMD